MLRFAAYLFLLCLPVLLPAQLSFAQDSVEVAKLAEKLDSIRAKIDKEEGRLRSLQEKQQGLRASQKTIEQELEDSLEKQSSLRAAQLRDKERGGRLEKNIDRAKIGIDKKRGRLNTRLVALYKTTRRTAGLDYLVRSGSATDLLKRAHYLSLVARADKTQVDQLATLMDEFIRQERALRELNRIREDRIEKLGSLGEKLEKQKFTQASLLDELKDKEKQRAQSLGKLKGSARKLEELLSGVMGREEPKPVKPRPAPRKGVAPAPAPFKGKGLVALRGKLQLPVTGKLVQPYGKQRHDEFADMLFVKGLEFKSPVGSKVKAVATGKVVLNQVLPGYGQVVILDHGKRYYTLYGRLASTLCQLGDVLSAGDVVAVLGEPDSKSRNFYFELRLKGKAVNPTRYFNEKPKLLPRSSSAQSAGITRKIIENSDILRSALALGWADVAS